MHLATWAVAGTYAEIVLRKKNWSSPPGPCNGEKRSAESEKR